MSQPKWIVFREIPAPGVTKRWEIVTKKGGEVIGWIGWSNGWRRYVIQPAMLTEWEQDCLRDVAAFIEEQTANRKAERLSRVTPVSVIRAQGEE